MNKCVLAQNMFEYMMNFKLVEEQKRDRVLSLSSQENKKNPANKMVR